MNRQQVAQGAVAAFAAAEALAWYLRRQEWARTLATAQQTAASQGRALLVLDGGVGAFHGPSGVTTMDLSRLASIPDGSAVVCAAYTLEMAADPQHLWQEFLRIASVPTMVFTASRQPWSAASAITPGTRWIVTRAGLGVPTFAPVGALRVAAWAAGAATAAPAAAAAPTAPATDAVTVLTGMLADRDATILKLNTDLATARTASADADTVVPGLLAIAKSVIGPMQVALGQADTSAALDAKAAIELHGRVEPVYKEKFPIGGVSRQTATTEVPAAVHTEFDQRLDEHGRLHGHVQRAHDLRSGERLGGAVLVPQRHQAGHLGFGDADFLAAPVGQADVGDHAVRVDGGFQRCIHVQLQSKVVEPHAWMKALNGKNRLTARRVDERRC